MSLGFTLYICKWIDSVYLGGFKILRNTSLFEDLRWWGASEKCWSEQRKNVHPSAALGSFLRSLQHFRSPPRSESLEQAKEIQIPSPTSLFFFIGKKKISFVKPNDHRIFPYKSWQSMRFSLEHALQQYIYINNLQATVFSVVPNYEEQQTWIKNITS